MAERSRGPSILRRPRCVLVCGRCGCDIATAETGPSGRVRVVHVSGVDVAPMQGVVAALVEETRLSDAEAASVRLGRSPAEDLEVIASRHAVAYLRKHAGEIAFDLRCPSCQARHWRSMPDLARELRGAGSERLTLR